MTTDDDREFIRQLFAPDPEDQPAAEPGQPATSSPETIPDFLNKLFNN
ncbi:hypothetical protein [Arthrobacter sp. B10-11]|nr:hypothetical protein [Arthrobacter sp. B10-11]MDV8147252.1 hypothetical protein [Arthrobacter sp. B10-11]